MHIKLIKKHIYPYSKRYGQYDHVWYVDIYCIEVIGKVRPVFIFIFKEGKTNRNI